jgi:hypothetical protein
MEFTKSFESTDARPGSAGPLLGAVMVRTFLSGFFLLSKAETPMKTFSTIAEGLAWLQALPGQDLSIKTEVRAADIERFIA